MGHFARFVRPGAQRVLCASARHEIEATAFANPDGGIAIVAVNRHNYAVEFPLSINGMCWQAMLPPHSIATFLCQADA